MKKAKVIFIILCLTILSTANVNAFENSFEENIPTDISNLDVSNMTFEERMKTLIYLQKSLEEKEIDFPEDNLPQISETISLSSTSESTDFKFALEGDANLLWSYETADENEEIKVDIVDDVNKDGAFDVLLFDENTLYLLSGTNGNVIWKRDYDVLSMRSVYEDLNSDDISELIIASVDYDTNINQGIIEISILDGASGQIVDYCSRNIEIDTNAINWKLDLDLEYEYPDMTGDGIYDIIMHVESDYQIVSEDDDVSNFEDTLIVAINPITCSILWEKSIHGDIWNEVFDFDCTDDGKDDLLVDHDSGFYLLSGSDGKTVINYSSQGWNDEYKCSKDTDMDGDGLPDIIIGTSIEGAYDPFSHNHIYSNKIIALKGTNGKQLWEKNFADTRRLTFNIAPLGEDIDDDSLKDIIAGIESYEYDHTNSTDIYENKVIMFSSADATEIWSTPEYDAYYVRIYTTKIDNDLVRDVFLVIDSGSIIEIQALKGQDGSHIWNYSGKYDSVEYDNDIDNDKKNDLFLISTESINNTDYTVNLELLSGTDGTKLWDNSYPLHLDFEVPENMDININTWTWSASDLNGNLIKDTVVSNSFWINYYDEVIEESVLKEGTMLLVVDGNKGNNIWSALMSDNHYYTGIIDFTSDDIDDVFFATEKGAYIVAATPVNSNQPPLASFTANVTSGEIPLEVQFTDKSSNYPTSWLWDFGDGSTSNDRNPIHTYDGVGNYTVSLKVTNKYGSDSITKTDHIHAEEPNDIPTATIVSISPNPTIAGEAIYFEGDGTDSDGIIVGYNWRSSINGQLDTNASFSTSALSAGNHTIYFKVQDNRSAWSAEASEILKVDDGNPYVSIDADFTDNISANNPVKIILNSSDIFPGATYLVIKNSTGASILTKDVTTELIFGEYTFNWNASDESANLLPDGTYHLYLNSTDAFGHTASSSVSLVVDNTAPSIDVRSITGTNTLDNVVYTNSELLVSISADVTPGNAKDVDMVLSSEFSNFRTDISAVYENGFWNGTFDLSLVPDDGEYTLKIVAEDGAKNKNSIIPDTIIRVDRVPPCLSSTISLINETHDYVNISSTEPLQDAPSVTVNKDTVEVEFADGHWLGILELDGADEQVIRVEGLDLAGNKDVCISTAHIELIEITDGEGSFQDPETGILIDFIAVGNFNDTITVIESTTNFMELSSGRIGILLLDVNLGPELESNLSSATIAIPVNESLLPTGISVNDAGICYYNESTAEWEELETTVQNINGIDYWVTHVEHFSSYALVADDRIAPELESLTPSSGYKFAENTTAVDIRFNYSDRQTGINVSAIVLSFDKIEITDSENATVTGSYATYNATGLAAGTHSASVYVADNAGNAQTFSTSFTISADTQDTTKTSSTSSSSGGGGGGGTTGEKYENILVKEVQSIFVNKDSHIIYEFKEEGNAITSIQFDSLKNSGKTQAIIEVLKDRSSFANIDAPGEIYQQMNIWVGKVGFVSPENVENLLIYFKVEKSWLEENKIEKDMLKLYRYTDDSWNELPTELTSEDDEYVYFQSQTPGFSPFAICSEFTKNVEEVSMKSTDNTSEETFDEIETKSNTTGILMVLGIIAVVLAGVFVVYRKRN